MAKQTLRGTDQQERAERLRSVFERLSSLSAKKGCWGTEYPRRPGPL